MSLEKKIKGSMLTITSICFVSYIILHTKVCSYENYINGNYNHCDIMMYRESILQPIALFAASLFITTLFTFFISNKTFKKWLIFTVGWFTFSIIWIANSPERSGGFGAVLATKEQVSMFMSGAFVIISLTWFAFSKINIRTWIKWIIGTLIIPVLFFMLLRFIH